MNLGRFNNFDSISEANKNTGKKPLYLILTSPSKKSGYWEEVLTGDFDKDAVVFANLMKDEIKKFSGLVGTKLAVIDFEDATHGSGETNYDVILRAELELDNIKKLLDDKKFLAAFKDSYGGIVTGKDETDSKYYNSDDLDDKAKKEILNYIEMNEKLTPAASDFVSKKIGKLRSEGKGESRAAAIAYSMAKKKGYKVKKNPNESVDANEALSGGDRDKAVKAFKNLFDKAYADVTAAFEASDDKMQAEMAAEAFYAGAEKALFDLKIK